MAVRFYRGHGATPRKLDQLTGFHSSDGGSVKGNGGTGRCLQTNGRKMEMA